LLPTQIVIVRMPVKAEDPGLAHPGSVSDPVIVVACVTVRPNTDWKKLACAVIAFLMRSGSLVNVPAGKVNVNTPDVDVVGVVVVDGAVPPPLEVEGVDGEGEVDELPEPHAVAASPSSTISATRRMNYASALP
jgi:hypothetical protein